MGYDIDPDAEPPLPDSLQGPGWAGYCMFTARGTYSFVCQAHPTMQGTIEVTGGAETRPPSPRPRPRHETATATPVVPAATPTVDAASRPHPRGHADARAHRPKISAARFKRSNAR